RECLLFAFFFSGRRRHTRSKRDWSSDVCSSDFHRSFLEVGSDLVTTNTFGANWANLAEYDIAERIYELAESGARLAREVVDEFSTDDHPRFVLGSVGPGTKLPTLGHVSYAHI